MFNSFWIGNDKVGFNCIISQVFVSCIAMTVFHLIIASNMLSYNFCDMNAPVTKNNSQQSQSSITLLKRKMTTLQKIEAESLLPRTKLSSFQRVIEIYTSQLPFRIVNVSKYYNENNLYGVF